MDRYEVTGRQVYDARLVAVMLTYGVTEILTMNASHFRRFGEINVVEPADARTPVRKYRAQRTDGHSLHREVPEMPSLPVMRALCAALLYESFLSR